MLAEERQELILKAAREQGSVKVNEIAERLGVSPVTVRRDVTSLVTSGLLDRVHGGATLPHSRAAAPTAGDAARPRAGGAEGPTVGMLVPSATYYFPEVVRGARDAVEAIGGRLVLGISRYHPTEDRDQVDQLLRGGVDGLLLTPSRAPGPGGEDAWMGQLPVPVVLVERRAEIGSGLEHLDRVASDHALGAAQAVRRLAGLDHRRILLVARLGSPTTPAVQAGYTAALAALGLTPPDPAGVQTPHPGEDPDGFDGAVARVVEAARTGAATAALVHNDQDALLLVSRLRAAGLDVPGDLALIAYDDEVAALADPPLSAIAPPKHEVGRTAVELLARRLVDGDESAPRHISLVPQLRLRATTGTGETDRDERSNLPVIERS
ncbi:substrate-binding domain-containing protein [Embleya sp. NBC_00896]|uniref:substrate-binding domain-containing protein n=1 Tax=Embleya sp. NBC_00896 TaxID=2975961 RepID=UPI002F91A0F7|nr:substrate-binding domain-containing protein [Embleya sp. NBC_00896]